LSDAVPLTARPWFALAGNIAVTVAGRGVGPRQVAVPNVASFALLMLTFFVSETDQETFIRFDIGATHPGDAVANEKNLWEFPGDALWSRVAFWGETLTPGIGEHGSPPPAQAVGKINGNTSIILQEASTKLRSSPLRRITPVNIHTFSLSIARLRCQCFSSGTSAGNGEYRRSDAMVDD